MTSSPDDSAAPSRADLLAELATLRGRFTNLAAIEQAKGALMVTYGLTADAAFDLLRFHSQTRNVKLRAIAVTLTSLLSTHPTSSNAIARFDRLITRVTDRLQTPPRPAADGLAAEPTVDLEAIASPGITIAANVPNLPLVYANDAFAKLTGYPIDDILGRNCRFLQGGETDPGDITTLKCALDAGWDVSVILQNYRSDGSPFLNRVSISPIRNPANQITHFIGTQIDVTRPERRRSVSTTRPASDRSPAWPRTAEHAAVGSMSAAPTTAGTAAPH